MPSVIFTGIKTGGNSQLACRRLAALFNASPEQIEQMLTSGEFVLKVGLSEEVALTYMQRIEAAGGTCRLEVEDVSAEPLEVDLPSTSPRPAENVGLVCSACGAAIAANDAWCAACGINVSETQSQSADGELANFLPQTGFSAPRLAPAPQEHAEMQSGASGPTTVVIVGGGTKSIAAAILLSVFFGPLGLMYASVVGGVVMFIVSLVVGLVTLGFGLFIIWPVCVIWAVLAVSSHNHSIETRLSAG